MPSRLGRIKKRRRSRSNIGHHRVVTIGDQLSVAHGEKDRFQAKIIAFCPKKGVKVHWVGWSKRYDEMIPRGSDRIWHKLQMLTSTDAQPIEWGHPPSFLDLPETLCLAPAGLGLDATECAATDVCEMWQALQLARKERLKMSVGDQSKYMKVVEELKDTIAKHDPRFADFEVVTDEGAERNVEIVASKPGSSKCGAHRDIAHHDPAAPCYTVAVLLSDVKTKDDGPTRVYCGTTHRSIRPCHVADQRRCVHEDMQPWLVCHMSAASVHNHDVCCLCFVRGCRRLPFQTKLLTGGRGDVWLFNSALIHDSTRHISDDSLRGVLLFKIRCVVARR